MADNFTLYVPLHMFPSAEQLAPFAPGAAVQILAEGPKAIVAWPDVRVEMGRMSNDQVGDHLSGFVGYARKNGGSEALVMRILHTLSVFGFVVEPGFDDDHRAMRFVAAINQATDGLAFDGAEVFDARGKALLRAGRLEPPDAARVAHRALVLLAVSMRGLLEEDAGRPDEPRAEKIRADLVAWLRRTPELVAECERGELAFLESPIGSADQQQVVDGVWRAEGAQVLLWALAERPLPAVDAQEHPYAVAKACGVLGEGLPDALATPRLRPEAELDAERRRLTGIHWRLRDFKLRQTAVDLRAFAAKSWFGGFDLNGIAIADNDLSIGGKPLIGADPGQVQLARSIASERHQAANWLTGVHPLYGRVGTPT